jgi:hypothetical protein
VILNNDSREKKSTIRACAGEEDPVAAHSIDLVSPSLNCNRLRCKQLVGNVGTGLIAWFALRNHADHAASI